MDLPTPTPSEQSPESPMNQERSKSEGLDDPLLSPLFLFPGEDTSTSSSSGSSSQHSGSPRHDWALPGAMWSQFSDSKGQAIDDLDPLSMSLNFPPGLSQDHWSSMDMDTDISALIPDASQHISIDPNTLHFPPTQEQDYEPMFQFTLSQPSDAVSGGQPPFQLPTPKPGSTSSRSVSPAALSVAEHVSNTGVNPNDLSLLTQLGQKARDASGVMLAVPIGQDSQAQAPASPVSAESQGPPSKVPIPRLRPSASAPQKSQFNFASPSHPTPPVSQYSSPPSMPQESASVMAPTATKSGRPKTSHTTIERRYRTNLNARILALRRAVPALRILEKNTPHQTQGKGLTGASASKWDFDDVVNERGYVDGVKAAKKNSKGVVLGKAVEYIKALKRRELRLKRESDGLRALLSGLVGGPELLREWEREWRQRFGGEEADEVDEDEAENEDGDAEEGDDGEEADSDEEDGRSKKRVRVEKKERQSNGPQGEKRKRGRPRKNPASDTSVSTPHLILQPPEVQDQRQQPSKYLLAAFVFFSFFNPNAPTSSALGKGHQGAVLTHELPEAGTGLAAGNWTFMQVVHGLVSVLLLVSLVGAYLPKGLTRFLPSSLLFASPPRKPSVSPSIASQPSIEVQMQPMREATISNALASGSERALRDALGADGGIYSVVKGLALAGLRRVLRFRKSTGEAPRTRQDEIELRGWRRIAQLTVSKGENAPLMNSIQTYLALSSHLSSSRLPSDNIELALLAYPFAATTAIEYWETARRAETKTSSETLVLDMDIEDAARLVVTAAPSAEMSESDQDEEQMSAVHRIAAHIVLSRAKALAAQKFVSSVSGAGIVDLDGGEAARMPDKILVTAGRELGGALGMLVSMFDKVERCSATEALTQLTPFETEFGTESNSSDSSSSSESDTDAQSEDTAKEVRTLLLATLLFRRIFCTMDSASTHVPSPPPSPSSKSEIAALHLALRRALASAAFDTSTEMEDARDRVVDMLAEARRGRMGAAF